MKSPPTFNFLLFPLILLFSELSFAAVPLETFHVSKGTADFYAIGKPSMLKIHGVSKSLEGAMNKKDAEISGTFSVKMADFSSGLSLRDTHTRDKIFEVEKYPNATLTLKPISPKSGEKTKFIGMLKFHGVEKEVQGEVIMNLAKDKIGIESSFTILLTDFNVQPPEFAGMKINNDVRVEVNTDAVK